MFQLLSRSASAHEPLSFGEVHQFLDEAKDHCNGLGTNAANTKEASWDVNRKKHHLQVRERIMTQKLGFDLNFR